MPSLLEILNDPNYQNANLATKQAIFDKYSAQDDNYVSANDATKNAIRQKFGLGLPTPQPTEQKPKPEEDESIFRSIADVPLSVGRGAVQGVRFLADTFGADNPVSNALRSTEDYIGDLMSAGAKRDAEEVSRIMKEAEDKGVGAQLAAALEALTVAPVDLISQALGTAAPTVLGGLAGFALKGGLKAGATAAQIASGSKLAGQIGAGVGGAMGAGVVKSTIYDAVYEELKKTESEEVARAKAEEAQSYMGENLDAILAGTALGTVAGIKGIEKNIIGRLSAKKAAQEAGEEVAKEGAEAAAKETILGAAAREAIPEAAQAGQEQLAANIALQREGFDVPTFRGVAGQAALEGLLGAGLGAGVEATGRLTDAVKPQTVDTTVEDLQTELEGDTTEEGGEPEKRLSPAQQFKALDPATLPQEKLLEIKDYLTKLTTGEITQNDAEKKAVFLNYSRQLGVPLPKRNSAKTLENAFNRLIAKAFGEGDVDGLGAGIGGEGTQVPGQPKGTAPGQGATEVGTGSVEKPGAPAGGVKAGTAGSDTSLKGTGKFDNLASLSKAAKTKTKKISTYADTEPLTSDELSFLQEVRRLERAGEVVPQEYKKQAEDLNMKLGETVETIYNEAASSTDLKARGLPAQYKKRQDEKGGALTEDERLFFEDALGTSTDTDSVNQAMAALSDYRDSKAAYAKESGIRADTRTDSIAAYEMNRREESEKTGIAFPRWTDLTSEEQKAFIDKVPFKQDTGPSGEAIQSGFDAVRPSLEATRAQQRDLEKSEEGALKDQEAQAYARQRQEAEDVRFGLSGALPPDLSDSIKSGAYKEGKSQPLISYLAKLARGATPKVSAEVLQKAEQQVAQAELELEQLISDPEALNKAYTRDPKFLEKQQEKVNAARRRLEKAKGEVDSFTAKIYRMIANVIGAQPGLNTKVVYVSAEDFTREGLSEDFVADYNPETDTIRVSDRGLNEQALLHEYVHAATINTIWKFLNGKRAELTPEQRRGVTQLIALYNNINGRFKAELKAKRNPVIDNALTDIYEFVSYGLTNPEFQAELQKLKVKRYKNTIKTEKYGDIEVEPVFYTDYFADDADIVDEAVAKALTTNEELRNLRDAATKENASEEVKEKWKEAKTKIAEGAKKPDGTQTAWQDFVHSVARVIGLTSRLGRAIRNFVAPREYLSRIKPEPSKTAKEVFEQVYGEDAKDFVDSVSETEEETEYTPQQKQAIKDKEKADVNLRNAMQDVQLLYEKVGSDSEKLREHPDYKKLNRAAEKAQAKYDAAIDKLEGLGVKDEFAPGETQYENRQRVATTFEPGYLGNVFLELMGAFSEIATAPEPVPNWSEGNVNIKGKPKVTPPTSQQTGTVQSFEDAQVEKLDKAAPSIGKRVQGLRKFFASKQGWTEAIRYAQNYRVRLDKFQEMLMRTNSLSSSGPTQNNTGTAVSTSSGIAEHAYQKEFYRDIDDANQILKKLSKSMGKNVKQVLARLHAYAIYLHDPERRKVKFLRDAPLKSAQAAIDRDKIIDNVIKIDRVKLGEQAAEAQAEQYMKKLEILVYANLDNTSSLADINNDAYNTLGPHTKAKIDNVFGKSFTGDNLNLANLLVKNEVDAQGKLIRDADGYPTSILGRIGEKTIKLNEESNYFSRPVKNLVDFYGFKNYFPFKGKSDMGPRDYQIDPFSQALSGELQDKQEAFDGRITDSDNPILNIINEASKSAMRVGRHRAGVTLSIKNNILNHKAGKKGIEGKLVKKIKFEDRFDKKLNAELRRGKKNIFHYNDDGTIEIYEISDPSMLEAIKKPIQGENWFVNTLGTATSFFGQMHTRYNPAFAPVDFLRNLFTYAGILGAEKGGTKGLKVLAEMAKLMVVENVFFKTARFSWAYTGGDEATINRLAKKDKFYADLKNYFEKGGRVSYVQGISYKENIMSAVQAADRNGVTESLDSISRVFDAWLDMFEMSTRVAAYRVIRAEYEKSMGKQDADIEAVAYAKNLANFEKMGLKGKEIGAAFMFFRPAATGAVRAVEALAPAKDVKKFLTGNTAELLNKIKEENKDVTGFTDADAQALLEEQGRRAKSSALVTVSLAGLGVFTYAAAVGMADDDDEGRNKTLTDDPVRWVRFARFNTGLQSGGQDLVLQIPWGFGLGAFASIGAQLAAFGYGAQPVGKTFNNIIDAGFESFGAIPFSKIDKFEHPVNWAIDSITPSALRPAVEWMSNMDGLGREIYNNRQSRNNDAYTGGDNIPELFKDAARTLYNITDGAVDWSPNTMYFFANNYFDAVSRFSAFTYNMAEVTTGEKNFDFKTDTLLFDAYMKAPSNYDARQFSEVKDQIMEIDRKYRAYSTSGDYDRFSRYLDNNPMDPAIVKFYNKFNSQIDKLRAAANQVRKDTTLSTRERNDQVRLIVKQQNQMKAAFVQAIGAFGIEPKSPYPPRSNP